MRHIISVLVENKFGVLARIAGLFSGRGFNIDSLSVGETTDKMISRMTIVTHGNDRIIEQITKQLNKVVDVIKVVDMTGMGFVEREMVLMKVKVKPETRAEILNIVDIFRGKIVDVGAKTYIIELTGGEDKVQAMIDLLKPFGIEEIARTGTVALQRGNKNASCQKLKAV